MVPRTQISTWRRFAGSAALTVALLVAGGTGGVAASDLRAQHGSAFDRARHDARTIGLARDLAAARIRLQAGPGRVDADLERARRELHWLQTGAPLDPELDRLQRRIQDLEWDRDRIARRRAMGESLRVIQTARERLPVPRELRPPYATDLRGSELPIGAGKQIILLQKSLRESDRALMAGSVAGAARYLARAEGALAAFQDAYGARLPPEDPQLVAVWAEISRLRGAIAAD